MASEELPVGKDGFSGEEEQVDLQDDEDELESEANNPEVDKDDITVVAFVARRMLNTVDTRPGGYAWFSA